MTDWDGWLEITGLSPFPPLQWTPFQTSPRITIWHIILHCVGRIFFWWSWWYYTLPCSWRGLKDHGTNSEYRFLFCFLTAAWRMFMQLNLINVYDPLLETLPPLTSGVTVHLNSCTPCFPASNNSQTKFDAGGLTLMSAGYIASQRSVLSLPCFFQYWPAQC